MINFYDSKVETKPINLKSTMGGSTAAGYLQSAAYGTAQRSERNLESTLRSRRHDKEVTISKMSQGWGMMKSSELGNTLPHMK